MLGKMIAVSWIHMLGNELKRPKKYPFNYNQQNQVQQTEIIYITTIL